MGKTKEVRESTQMNPGPFSTNPRFFFLGTLEITHVFQIFNSLFILSKIGHIKRFIGNSNNKRENKILIEPKIKSYQILFS